MWLIYTAYDSFTKKSPPKKAQWISFWFQIQIITPFRYLSLTLCLFFVFSCSKISIIIYHKCVFVCVCVSNMRGHKFLSRRNYVSKRLKIFMYVYIYVFFYIYISVLHVCVCVFYVLLIQFFKKKKVLMCLKTSKN